MKRRAKQKSVKRQSLSWRRFKKKLCAAWKRFRDGIVRGFPRTHSKKKPLAAGSRLSGGAVSHLPFMKKLGVVWKRFSVAVMQTISRMSFKMKLIALGGTGVLVAGIVLLCTLGGRGADTSAGDPAIASDAADAQFVGVEIAVSPTITPSPTPYDPTLQKGLDGPQVVTLQARLMDLGFLDLDEPTEHFGSQTKAAVKLFQRQNGLQQDGIVGPLTLEMIYSETAKNYEIEKGMQGSDVDSIQEQLVSLGYMQKTTGTYDDTTIAAVKEFQKRNKLTSDGVMGEDTMDQLFSSDAVLSATKVAAARKKANISKMISVAQKQLGKPYVLGASGPNRFDCSGLVYYCMKQAGGNRIRMNAAGYSKVSDWKKITSMSALQRGDLIFYMNNARTKVGHVAIYLGGGVMIDASSSNGKVVKRTCTSSYWKRQFVCGRRPW